MSKKKTNKNKKETRTRKCDCWKFPHQVCDICQGVTGNEKDREPLTFQRFQEVNIARSKSDIKHSLKWSPMEWGCALSGEVGELCNYLKKLRRGDKIPKKMMAHEVADIITYLSLLSDNLDIDLEDAIIEKFNIVSKRWGSKVKL